MKYEAAVELAAALRSGKYKQARGVLKDAEGGMCCLGVFCDVKGAKWNYKEGDECSTIEDLRYGEKAVSTVLPKFFRELGGFAYSNGATVDDSVLYVDQTTGKSYGMLTTMNDDRIPFEVIADVIEKHWEKL